jgi:hypothetical protein
LIDDSAAWRCAKQVNPVHPAARASSISHRVIGDDVIGHGAGLAFVDVLLSTPHTRFPMLRSPP